MKIRFITAVSIATLTPALAFASEGAAAEAPKGALEAILASPIIPPLGEFIPMVIAFLALLFLLGKFAWPTIIGSLDARAEKIEGSVKLAEEAKLEAENILAQYQGKLAEARKEAGEIVEAGRKAGEAARAEIISKANDEAAGILERAQASIETEKRTARAALEAQVAEFSVAIAGKLIGEKLSAEADAKLIDKYLAEMGSFNDN